ncbi:MAG: hypothetical protein LUD14_06240 [Clostridiales bacterium]|nr:hypothetical protein [Clostridiales bacterium]
MLIDRKKKIGLLILAMSVFLPLYGCGGGAEDAESALSSTVQNVVENVSESLSEAGLSGGESSGSGGRTVEIESVSEDKYAWQVLDDEEQTVYDEIVYAISNRVEELELSTTDVDVMGRAYQAVRYDYCEFFWLDQLAYVTNSRNGEIVSITLTPTYTVTEEEQEALQEQIDSEATRMLADAPVDGSDYDKALYVYETLIREVDYVTDSENNQNIISVFINHETICQGYAYATQYLLEQLGIPCTTVIGTANGAAHAWNLVVLDGEYYYIDTTWGNARFVYLNENGEDFSAGDAVSTGYLNYDYFGVTTETLLMTHEPDSEIPLPDCTATADNYYIHEGLYVEAWDVDVIGGIIRDAYESGQQAARIRFVNAEMCEQALQYFVEDSRLFDYCSGLKSVQYLENADSAVMVILFT